MDPSKSALLVLDVQPAILAMLKDDELAKKLLVNTRKLVEGARARGVTVVFVRVAFTDEEFQNIPSTNKVSIPVAKALRFENQFRLPFSYFRRASLASLQWVSRRHRKWASILMIQQLKFIKT